MTAKEYLCSVQDKDNAITEQKQHIEALRGVLESLGVSTDSERVQSSSDHDKFGKIFAQIDEEERRLEQMEKDFLMFKVRVILQIKEIPTAKHRVLLHERYINYKSFKVISVQMGYCYDYILELHGDALKEFGSIPC